MFLEKDFVELEASLTPIRFRFSALFLTLLLSSRGQLLPPQRRDCSSNAHAHTVFTFLHHCFPQASFFRARAPSQGDARHVLECHDWKVWFWMRSSGSDSISSGGFVNDAAGIRGPMLTSARRLAAGAGAGAGPDMSAIKEQRRVHMMHQSESAGMLGPKGASDGRSSLGGTRNSAGSAFRGDVGLGKIQNRGMRMKRQYENFGMVGLDATSGGQSGLGEAGSSCASARGFSMPPGNSQQLSSSAAAKYGTARDDEEFLNEMFAGPSAEARGKKELQGLMRKGMELSAGAAIHGRHKTRGPSANSFEELQVPYKHNQKFHYFNDGGAEFGRGGGSKKRLHGNHDDDVFDRSHRGGRVRAENDDGEYDHYEEHVRAIGGAGPAVPRG